MNRLHRVLSIASLVVVTAFAGVSMLAAPKHLVQTPGMGYNNNNVIVPAGDDNGGDH